MLRKQRGCKPLHTAGGNVKWSSCYGNRMVVPEKVKNKIAIWSRIVYNQKNWKWGLRQILYIIYSSIIHNNQRHKQLQCTQMNEWMNNMVYTYNGMLFSHKGGVDLYHNMDEPWRHTNWTSQSQVWFHLDEIPRVVKFIGTENRMVFGEQARTRGKGNGKLVLKYLMGTKFLFRKMKNCRWMVVMDSQRSESYLMPVNYCKNG
jgi:hypothetical protein